jgi:hypothetical protein
VLPHLTVTCISKTKRLRTYVRNIFDLFFNKESLYGKVVREFRFTPYITVVRMSQQYEIQCIYYRRQEKLQFSMFSFVKTKMKTLPQIL